MMPPKIPNIPEIGDSYSPGLRCPCSNSLMYCWLNPDSSFHLFLGQPLFAPDSCPSHPAMDACRDVAGDCPDRREVLGMTIGNSEAEPFWTDFLRSLTRRGLRGVKLVVSDAP